MPIGYIKGNTYMIDHNYDRHAGTDIFKMLHREAGKRRYAGRIKFSHMTRGYVCEVIKMQDFKPLSAHVYYTTLGHKYAPSPLEATLLAFKECIPADPLMLALYLEAEMHLLNDAVVTAMKIEGALDMLREVLDSIPITFLQGDTVIGTYTVGELRPPPIPKNPMLNLMKYQEGDTAEDEEWRATMARSPSYDEDDDL